MVPQAADDEAGISQGVLGPFDLCQQPGIEPCSVGDAGGETGHGRLFSSGQAEVARQRPHIIFGESRLHQGACHAQLLEGATSRTEIAAIIGVVAIEEITVTTLSGGLL